MGSMKLTRLKPLSRHRGSPVAERRLAPFTGGAAVSCACVRPDRLAFWRGSGGSRNPDVPVARISRGGGYSYVDASFGADALVVDHARFNRILGFDDATGLLTVEAGATLGAVFNFLHPRGWYLPVQPGYPLITVGGCIAADVHGKNPYRDGTFRSHVESLELHHPDKGTFCADREREAEVFDLTCGGYGLTGHIVRAVLRAAPLPSRTIRHRLHPVDLADFPKQFTDVARTADLAHTWQDFAPRGAGFGRGFIMEGNFDPGASEAARGPFRERNPLTPGNRGSWRVPLFTPATTKLFTAAYYTLLRLGASESTQCLWDFTFPISSYRKVYFKLFGARGQLEYQSLLPVDALDEFLARVRQWLTVHPLPITLGSAKLFSGDGGLLRFQAEGVSLSLDFPYTPEGEAFALFLDGVVPDLGGRPNIIKDARLPDTVVRRAYPGYEEFRERLHAYDPARRFASGLSRRLGL